MKPPLPDDIFQVGAVVLAKLHFHNGSDIEANATKLWKDYARGHADPNAQADWIKAGQTIVHYLRDEIAHEHPFALLHLAQEYCQKFDDNGDKWKTGFLGRFGSKIPTSPDRIDRLMHKLRTFRIVADSGLPLVSE